MDERSYLRTLAEKLMLYASPKKLETMLEDLHILWEGHRQEGYSEIEIFEQMGSPTLLLDHTRREGRSRMFLIMVTGILAFALSMALIYTTLYVSTGWILPTALLLLLFSLWLLAGGTGMGLLSSLTQAHPHGLLPYSIPFFATLMPIAICFLCFYYPIGLFGLLPPEQFGNTCTIILRICILAMTGQAIWFFLKTRRMGGGYFFLVIQAVGSAFCSLSLLRYLTRMDLTNYFVSESEEQMLLLSFVVFSLLYYLGGLLFSLLLFFRIRRGEGEEKPWIFS